MEQQQAATTLIELERLREGARADLRAFSFPLVLFGLLMLLAGLLQLAADLRGLFWPVAAPLAATATAGYYSARARPLIRGGNGLPYLLISPAVALAALLAPLLLDSRAASLLGPAFAIAAGYLAFALLERSRLLAALAATITTLAAILFAVNVGRERGTLILTFATGALLLATGLSYRHRRTRL